MQGKALRALRLAVVVLAVGAVLMLAQQRGSAATALALGGLALAGLAWWWWRRPDVAGTVGSLVVTCLLTSEITYAVGVQVNAISPLQLGLAFWLFAAVVVVTVWLAPRQRGSRAVTVVIAHAILVVASALSYFSTAIVPIAGLIAALAVVGWRSRQRRWPPRTEPQSTLEERTTSALGGRGDGWELHGNVLTGPAGHYYLRDAGWDGRVELAGGNAYTLDGDAQALSEQLQPIVNESRRFAARQGLQADELTGVVVFWDATRLPDGGVVELTVFDTARRRRTGTRVVLVRGEKLLAWLGEQVS
ncbi:hypothetical protein [Flindersiella endophytica]